jgi:hemolysin activation/secretion protein
MFFIRFLLLVVGIVVPVFVYAQGLPPGALEQLRTDERLEEIRRRQEAIPDVRLQNSRQGDVEILPENETPCFAVRSIVLNGEGTEAFAWLSVVLNDATAPDSPIGRCLGEKGVEIIHRRAQNALIEKGFMTTRVYLEAQDLKSGELVLTLVPGRLRRLEFRGNVPERWRLKTASVTKAGELINLRDVEQMLENLERVPGVKADIQVFPGEAPGESDLVVMYEAQRSIRGALSLDDGGLKSTGKYQAGLSFFWDNPVGLNDTFYLTVNHDLDRSGKRENGVRAGSSSVVLHYAFPIGYWESGVTYSASQNDQRVAGAFMDYRYRSKQQEVEVSLGRGFYRDQVSKANARVSVFRKTYRNYIGDVEVDVQRRRVAGWKVDVNYQRFIGNGVLSVHTGYRRGTGALRAFSLPEEPFGEGTSRYKILDLGVNLAMPFAVGERPFQYRMDWRGQWNFSDLSSTDKFMIAGRHTVRGFDGETVLASERGWLVRNEVIMPLAGGAVLPYLGLDYGEVHGKTSRFLVGRRLSGMVLGVRGRYHGVDYDLFAGTPLLKPDHFEAGKAVGFNLGYNF